MHWSRSEPGRRDSGPSSRIVKAELTALKAERRTADERHLTEINEQMLTLQRSVVDQCDVAKALRTLDPLWSSFSPREQARVIDLLVARVDYNGEIGKVVVTFHASGIKSLAGEAA